MAKRTRKFNSAPSKHGPEVSFHRNSARAGFRKALALANDGECSRAISMYALAERHAGAEFAHSVSVIRPRSIKSHKRLTRREDAVSSEFQRKRIDVEAAISSCYKRRE